MFLNDLRWTPDMIAWQEFLNLLEGQTVHLATPKSHYAQDIILSSDIPVFATSISMIKFSGSRIANVKGENAMMEARWRKFQFFAQIQVSEQNEAESCPRCFSELVFMGDNINSILTVIQALFYKIIGILEQFERVTNNLYKRISISFI